jgi:hypothetical protein
MFGTGPMYIDVSKGNQGSDAAAAAAVADGREALLDFDTPQPSLPSGSQPNVYGQGVNSTPKNIDTFLLKNIDKPQRKITEIRIFYDDQTWESFVPKK